MAAATVEAIELAHHLNKMVAAAATTPPPMPPGDSLAVVPAHPSIQAVYVADARSVAVTTHEFFAEVLPNILVALLVFSVIIVIAWMWTKFWAFLLRQCGVPEHWVRFSKYVWAIVMLLVAVAAALGAIGVNVGHAVLALGLMSIAFSYGLGDLISNVVSGIRLQTNGLFANHKSVRVAGIEGTIVSMNLLYVVVKPTALPTAGSRGGSVEADSVLVPNTMFTGSPVEVWWERGRAPDYEGKPSRGLSVANHRTYGLAKRQADQDAGTMLSLASKAMEEGRFSSMQPHQTPGAATTSAAAVASLLQSTDVVDLAKQRLDEQRRAYAKNAATSGGSAMHYRPSPNKEGLTF